MDRMLGYSTHGQWSKLSRIRELELERGNYFPEIPYPDDTPAIWICLRAEDCSYYEPDMKPAEVEINERSVLLNYDYNGGFLLLQPEVKNILPERLPGSPPGTWPPKM